MLMYGDNDSHTMYHIYWKCSAHLCGELAIFCLVPEADKLQILFTTIS